MSQHRVQWKDGLSQGSKKKWQQGVPALPPGTTARTASGSQGIISSPAGDGTPANIPPKEADQEQAVSWPERRKGLTNWTPWIVGAFLAVGALVFLRNAQTRKPASVAAGPVDSAPKRPVDKPPRPDRQLKTGPDPLYME